MLAREAVTPVLPTRLPPRGNPNFNPNPNPSQEDLRYGRRPAVLDDWERMEDGRFVGTLDEQVVVSSL